MPTVTSDSIGELSTPQRNRYFYGKLMDVNQFEKDQRYFNYKRALINRTILGRGVVCGLDVVADPDSANRILILPGFAVEGRGCEIVSVEPLSVDPHQLTNDQGDAEGDPIETGTVEICIAYDEVEADLVPVLVPECDGDGNCAPCTIREEFRLVIRLAEDDTQLPPGCEFRDISSITNSELHALECERISSPCAPDPSDSCVLLARVSLPLTDESIDSCASRPLVYNNALLHELLLCLTAQVAGLSQGNFLRVVSGNEQNAAPDESLAEPLVVEMVDAQGSLVTDGLVQFDVTQGDGNVSLRTNRTNRQGRAQTRWTLGPGIDQQQVVASTVGTSFTVTFSATPTV